jgi:hypothetical protein
MQIIAKIMILLIQWEGHEEGGKHGRKPCNYYMWRIQLE